jgi:hypothetical protein
MLQAAIGLLIAGALEAEMEQRGAQVAGDGATMLISNQRTVGNTPLHLVAAIFLDAHGEQTNIVCLIAR